MVVGLEMVKSNKISYSDILIPNINLLFNQGNENNTNTVYILF
jgi:hypothetical protein